MRGVTVGTAISVLAITAMVQGSLAHAVAGNPAQFRFEPVLSRFNEAAPPTYRALRRLEAGRPDSDKHGWMEVSTQFHPDRGFQYEVVREGGYEYVRNKVLRGVLKKEAELIARGVPLRAPIVPRNYDVTDGGVLDSGMHRLLLHPVRKTDGVVNGSALVEPASAGIVRLEGRLAKNPSFWTRDVDVLWRFKQIGDTIVPVELSSTARIVIYGRQPFKMTYEYESIGGQRVDGVTLRAATGVQEK